MTTMTGIPILGYNKQAFFETEATFGTPIAPTGSYGCRVKSLTFEVADDELTRDDKRDTRSAEARVKGKRNVTMAMSMTNSPSGTAGAAPDHAVLLTTCFTQDAQAEQPTFDGSPAPTTTGGTVDDASALAEYDIRGVTLSDGTIHPVVLTDITGNVLTWWPTLPSAPAAGSVLAKAVKYTPAANPTNTVTLYRAHTDYGECASGCVADGWTFNFDAADFARVDVTGKAKDLAWMKSGMLIGGAGVNNSVTSIPISGDIDGHILDSGTFILLCETERMAVTGMDLTASPQTLTVTRGHGGTTPASHAAGKELTLYWPTVTHTGNPPVGVAGACYIDDEAVDITTASVTINENAALQNGMFGTQTAIGRLNPAKRAVTFNINAILKQEEIEGSIFCDDSQQQVMLYAGSTAGNIFVIYMRSVQFDTPNVPDSDEDTIELPLSGVAIASLANKETEVLFAYL